LIQAIIATALGVVSSLAQGGPLGIAMAAIVGVLGAIEIAGNSIAAVTFISRRRTGICSIAGNGR
jgi:hypothetical protein